MVHYKCIAVLSKSNQNFVAFIIETNHFDSFDLEFLVTEVIGINIIIAIAITIINISIVTQNVIECLVVEVLKSWLK